MMHVARMAAPLPTATLPLALGAFLICTAGALPPPPGSSLHDATFVAFDTETTGLKAADGRILEIGAVKFRNGRVVSRKCWLINPGIPIPEASRRIHGITEAVVSNCPPFKTVYPEFAAFAEGATLLAHNAAFDRRFIMAELERNDLDAPARPLFDTLPLCRSWFPGLRSYSLESLTRSLLPDLEHESLPAEGNPAAMDRIRRFHSALWDAECTAALFMKGVTRLPDGAPLETLTNDLPKVSCPMPARKSKATKTD